MAAALALCLALAGEPAGAAPARTTVLPAATATLAWTHSIEKIRWEEDWAVADPATSTGLSTVTASAPPTTGPGVTITEARIRGSGAGMEIPEGAVLRDGVWHYRPGLPPLPAVRLTQSPYVPPYTLCVAGDCRPLPGWLAGGGTIPDNAVIELRPCPASP